MSVTWVPANLGAFLPPGTTELIDTIQTTIDTIKPMLEAVNSALESASAYINGIPVFDWAALLADLIAKWKNDFLMTGLYMLPLWDYPIKQLQFTKDYGPSRTFGVMNFRGSPFTDLVDDISRSMLSQKDPNRPRFYGDCAALILIAAYPSIAHVPVTMDDSGMRNTFPGLKDVTGAAHGILELRWQGAMRKMRDAVNLSPADVIESRTADVVEMMELFSTFDRDERVCIPIPGEDIGDPFFENTAAADIPYTSIQSTVSAVQSFYESPEYPCWSRVNMTDLVPGLQAFADEVFDPIIATLKAAKNMQQVVLDIIESIKQRIDALQAIVNRVDYILAQLNALLKTTDFYAVFINSTSGTQGIMNQLRESAHPFVDSEGRPKNQFFIGMVLVAGGPSVAAFRRLMAPIAGA